MLNVNLLAISLSQIFSAKLTTLSRAERSLSGCKRFVSSENKRKASLSEDLPISIT